MSVEIESADVVRLMLQFMKENNLMESWKALSQETEVSLNTVDNLENFVSDIHNGRWESVIMQVNNLKVPQEKLISLYEQIIFELLEMGERDLARELLRNTDPMAVLKGDQPDRYLKLEHLCKRPFFNALDAYEAGSSKERRRQEIAEMFVTEVSVVPPSRLLGLLGQALRFQQSQGVIPKGGSYDLFKGSRRSSKKDTDEKYPKRLAGQIKFTATSHPETATFTPDGTSLVTGSIDGFIEVWDHDQMKLRNDLEYQAKDEFMMHEEAVLCSAFSRDGELLATGSQGGKVKIWKLASGACLRKFPQAHPQGITHVTFSRDSTQLLTTSFDHTARIHGLKSGKTLKEFRGHTSYVNSGLFVRDGSHILTGSSDGTVKLWEAKTSDCVLTIRPGIVPGAALKEITVHTLQLMPNNPEHVFICGKSPLAHLATIQGQIIRTYSSGKTSGGDFLCGTVSPGGKWVYCVGEDGVLYVFDAQSGQLENVLDVVSTQTAKGGSDATDQSKSPPGGEVIGISHHPQRNLLVTMTDGGQFKMWRP